MLKEKKKVEELAMAPFGEILTTTGGSRRDLICIHVQRKSKLT